MSLTQEIEEKISEFHGNTRESAYDVLMIPAKSLGAIWPYATPFIITGMQVNPRMSIKDIADGLVDQSVQLWVITPRDEDGLLGCFLSSIERDKGEWVLSLYGLGGAGAKDWVMAVHEAAHDFARAEGARRVRMCGRKAWQRILPNYAVVGEKDGHLIYERAVE
jgi:hypothetical protein